MVWLNDSNDRPFGAVTAISSLWASVQFLVQPRLIGIGFMFDSGKLCGLFESKLSYWPNRKNCWGPESTLVTVF